MLEELLPESNRPGAFFEDRIRTLQKLHDLPRLHLHLVDWGYNLPRARRHRRQHRYGFADAGVVCRIVGGRLIMVPVQLPRPSPQIHWLELFKNALFSIADEMAVTICRTTYSGVLRDNMDFSTGFADGDGNLVAQGLTITTCSTPTALQTVLDRYGDINPGDMFILNDPYDGGMHLPDIFIFKPIFIDEDASHLPQPSVTTLMLGDVCPAQRIGFTEIFQEELRIPPMKLYESGKLNDTLWRLVETNVRIPVQVFGDLRAQLAACNIAEKQFTDLVDRHGMAETRHYMGAVVDYAERIARAAISKLPDGEWSFEDWIDDDGVDYDKPIRLFCTVKKSGDRRVDWEGTSEQVKGAINATLSFCKAVSYAAVCTVLDAEIPGNEGLFRAIEVRAPEGSIVNMVPPAPCAARGLTGYRMGDCAFGALAMMLPNRVMASSDGGNTGISIGGYDDERNPFIFVDFACGSWGGRPVMACRAPICLRTWLASRSRSSKRKTPCRCGPSSLSPTGPDPENFAVAFRIGANISSSSGKRYYRFGLIARNTGLTACMAGGLVRLPTTRSILKVTLSRSHQNSS